MSIASRIQEIETHIRDVYDTIDYSYDTTGVNKNIINIPKYLKKGYIDIINNGTDTLYSNFPKVSGIGSNLSLTPTYEAPMKLNEIQGDTEQDGTPTPSSPVPIENVTGLQNVVISNSDSSSSNTYEVNLGKNLLDYSTLQDGYCNNIGGITTTHEQGEMYSEFIKVNPNTTYTFKIFETSSSYNNWIGIGEYTANNLSSFIQRITMTTATQNYYTFTTSATTQYVIVSARNLENATKVQLEKGQATSYSPYFTPIELNNIPETEYQDTIKKSSGKNLFDKSTITTGQYIDASGNLVNDNSNFVGDYIPIDNTKSYYVSQNAGGVIRVGYYDSNKAFISRQLISANYGSLTIPNNAVYVRLSCYNQSLNALQLEIGSTATSYEPYGKVWYEEKQCKKYDVYSNITTLVGTYNNVNYLRIVKPSDYLGYNTYNDIPFLFSHGAYRSAGGDWDNINNINTITNRANLGNWWLCIEINDTLEEIKEKLIGSYAIYPLTTPTYTEITNTELIEDLETLYTAKSQEGTTNISITSEDLEMILNVSVLKGEE